MFSVGDPLDFDGFRQLVLLHVITIAKRISFTLQNQGGSRQIDKMFGAELIGFAWWMKRVAKANQSVDFEFVGNK